MQHFDHILEALARRTQRVFDTALGAERHQLLTRRLHQLYGALELARLLEHSRLARRIETQVDACRRNIEADSGTSAS
jgi:HPt (histidine-containing phosphotransfer) domain-containing protein